jgi:hypothetical protein
MANPAQDPALVDDVMPAVPVTRVAVLALLEEQGPLHATAIAEQLDKNVRTVRSAIRLMRELRLVHISGWHRNVGVRGDWAAIYAHGNGPDRKPPQVDVHKQANERYREKYREVLRRRMSARRGRPVDPWLAILQTN